jgi:hypothetical protein
MRGVMAFKKKRKLFVDDGRPHGTVILNWHGTPEGEFTCFAESFRVLAQESVVKLKENPRFGLHGIPLEDFKAYPVIYLYRHALELYMKAVLLIGSDMLSLRGKAAINREVVLKTHNLDELRQELERVFEVYGWKWDLGSPHFRSVKDLRSIIGELHVIDAGSYAFRYPVDTKGAASLEQDFRFNVFRFCSILDELFPTLEGAVIGAHEVYQNTIQTMGEAQEYEAQNEEYHEEYHEEYDYYEPDYFEPPYEDPHDE